MRAHGGELGHLDFLQVLCQDEITRRESVAFQRRLCEAKFEQRVTLEEFDFAASLKLAAAQIRDLGALRWLHAGESVILFGPVGVGKTHVAQALGHLAVRQGANVRFAKTSRILAEPAGGHAALRTGRVMCGPHRQSYKRQPRMAKDMVVISERPAEAADRAIPWHREGDLIIGKADKSAIGTLVEHSSRFVALIHLSDGRRAARVRDALIQAVSALPAHLRRSLTWDQGSEMHLHSEFSTATDMPVYFCDPGSPWQRGSNENTNGLLRQYLPQSTDLARDGPEELDAVAAELNSRPRKTLRWETSAERLAKLLATAS